MNLRPSQNERTKYGVDYSKDTDFSAYARLLQSKWRESKKLPYNRAKYGNFLPAQFAKTAKSNFLTENIKLLVEYELLRKANFNKLIREDRMWENLLSSQPLCFNLFGELHFDHKLATKFFKKLFPQMVDKVTDIFFEHSPGRGNEIFTGDHSAFDIFVEYSREGIKGFIGIEVKYAECLKEESSSKAEAILKKHSARYSQLTTLDVFKPGAIMNVSKPPLSQIWRDHLLSISTRNSYDEGFFVFLFPSQNSHCKQGVEDYQNFLIGNNSDQEKTGFYPRHLDDFIRTLRQLHPTDWTAELEKRYLGT